MKCPESLKYWTADEVAECLSFPDPGVVIYAKLWNILNECKNPTPLGGDGSNGTVEEPSGRLDEDNDDKAPHWWDQMSDEQQQVIASAAAKEAG